MRFFNIAKEFIATITATIKKRKGEIIAAIVIFCILFVAVKGCKKMIAVSQELKKPPYASSESSNQSKNDPQTDQTETENIGSDEEEPSTTFRISPEGCMTLFDKTPKEFIPVADTFFQWTDNFAEAAILDEDGFLLLTLSEKSQNEWKEAWQPYLDKAEACSRITISKDYTQITVAGFKETIAEDLITSRTACHACIINLFLKHQNFESIKIKYTIIDGKTNETKKIINWPEQGFFIQLSNTDFSSIK